MKAFRNFDKVRRAIVIGACALVAMPALAQEAPDALVKRVSQEVLQVIKTDPKVQAGDQARIRELIETKLIQHFDFERMAALAMGRNWAKATPEQQKQIAEEFRSLLVRTYSGALIQYRNQEIDYGMTRSASGWKAYDIVVGGVSLVTNYRDEFNEQIRQGGVDGLIKSLQARNQGGAAK